MTEQPSIDREPNKSIFLTGGTGFVGGHVIGALLARGYCVRALVRSGRIDREGIESVAGDLFDDTALDRGMQGADAAIHLVGIIRENPARGQTFERLHYQAAVRVIDAARRNGVRRFVHMSALGARIDSPSEYASTKARAENELRQSGLDYTILRPSIIIGQGGEFLTMIADWSRGKSLPYLFMPYFGSGLLGQSPSRVQPIRVQDVARAFVDCLQTPATIGKSLDLVGPDQFTWAQMYQQASRAIRGKPRTSIGIPIWYARLLTRIAPASTLPFNRAQIEMAGEDSISSTDATIEHFGWAPESIDWSKFA
jgi:NADH dehydrogenase